MKALYSKLLSEASYTNLILFSLDLTRATLPEVLDAFHRDGMAHVYFKTEGTDLSTILSNELLATHSIETYEGTTYVLASYKPSTSILQFLESLTTTEDTLENLWGDLVELKGNLSL